MHAFAAILLLAFLILPPVFVIHAFIHRAWKNGLVVLIVYVLILGGLAHLLSTIRGAKERPRQVVCITYLDQLGKAMRMYSMDNNGCRPFCWFSLLSYAACEDMYVCPSSGTPQGSSTNLDQWTDYVLVANLKENDPAQAVQAFCPPKNHGGRGGNVLFVDGSVEWTPAKAFDALFADPCRFFGTNDVARVAELQHRVTIRPPYDSVLRVPAKSPPPR